MPDPASPPRGRLFVPLAVVLVFNLLFAGSLPPGYGTDEGLPVAWLGAEHLTRVITFGIPLFLRECPERAGVAWGLVWGGVAVYCASWLPLLTADGAPSAWVLAALPAATPSLFLYPIAWATRSAAYALVVTAFLALHVGHIVWVT